MTTETLPLIGYQSPEGDVLCALCASVRDDIARWRPLSAAPDWEVLAKCAGCGRGERSWEAIGAITV